MIHTYYIVHNLRAENYIINEDAHATQRVKIAEKVHKPPLGINFINFEPNGFNASIWVSWCHTGTKKL